VVADSARPAQRALNLQTNRYGVLPRRLKSLRMGSRVERQPQFSGARALVQRRPAPTHYMEGATSRATCNRIFPTTTTGTQRLAARRQHHNSGYDIQANHTLPRHDNKINEAMALS
jgi:hypothetical protein